MVFTVFPFHATAADPDGVRQHCQERLNKRGEYNCGCIVEKYYPKKSELEQALGVPIQDIDAVAIYVMDACMNVAKTGSREYNTCIQSAASKKDKQEFGAERFCKCYADEWEKELAAFQKTPNAIIDKSSRSHLKAMARANCRRKFR